MKALLKTLGVGLVAVMVVATPVVYEMPRAEACGSTPFLGEICIFAFSFCPRGYAATDGQLLSIAQYQDLFLLLGTTYGGDGQNTFGLPNLQGRTARGTGVGSGLSPVFLGDPGGTESVTLSIAQMPAHSHILNATSTRGNRPGPSGKILSRANPDTLVDMYSTASPDTTMAASSIGATGGGSPVATISPFLGLTHCIAVVGLFPPQP
jgi:microcystin-dependent protein